MLTRFHVERFDAGRFFSSNLGGLHDTETAIRARSANANLELMETPNDPDHRRRASDARPGTAT